MEQYKYYDSVYNIIYHFDHMDVGLNYYKE